MYLTEQCDLEASKFFEVDVHQAKGPLSADSLQQLLEITAVGQRERAGVIPHLYTSFLGSFLSHRYDQTIRLHLCLNTNQGKRDSILPQEESVHRLNCDERALCKTSHIFNYSAIC